MNTEYERGFRDCITIACLLCCQLRGPTKPAEFIDAIQKTLPTDECNEYSAGVSAALEKIHNALGPTALPLYPGDLYEIREVINKTSF